LKLTKFIFPNIAFSFFVALFLILFSFKGSLNRIELTGRDLLFRIRTSPPAASNKIIIIEITDSDIAKVGRWPWPRIWLASIAQALSDLGAKAIFFDFVLSEPSSTEDDDLLEAVLKRTNNVYLPFVFDRASFNINTAFVPIKRFSQHIKGTGAINIYPDEDGIIRKAPLIFLGDKEMYQSVGLKMAMDYRNLELVSYNGHELILGNQATKLTVPLVENNSILLNWSGKWENTFKHYGFLDVLNSYQDLRKNIRTEIDTNDFKDSICLIALTAVGLYDIKAIPIEAEYPGVGITATVFSNLIEGDFLYKTPIWLNLALLCLICLLPVLLIRGTNPIREFLIILTLGMIYFYIVFILFQKGMVLNFITPLLGLALTSGLLGIFHLFRISKERYQFFKLSVTDNLTGLYNIRYFRVILETELMLAEPNPRSKFCLIMADIDNFKHYNDTFGHQAGDTVIREVAWVLKTAVRSSDVLGRYGGEEIIILLRGATLKDAILIAEKMRKNIESLNVKVEKDTSCHVTASFGAVSYRPGDNMEGLIKRADEGLYKAKLLGRNQVYSPEE
jgi:diguanylate cyclase (GGDEF)-like protein